MPILSASVDLTKSPVTKEVTDKYAVLASAFIQKPGDDPRNATLVEIGDTKQADFYPQIKFTKWENEANLSFRYIEDGQAATVETSGSEIIYKGVSIDAKFYDLGTEDEGGGFEHEIIITAGQIPAEISWSVVSKAARLDYQPPLNEEYQPGDILDDDVIAGVVTESEAYDTDGNLIIYRPPHIVDSWAIYSDFAHDYTKHGGKNYKTGKIGHIHRLKATDANGLETWLKSSYDAETGIFKAHIPQKFIDTAVLPVIIDPTFGYTSVGGTDTTTTSIVRVGGTETTGSPLTETGSIDTVEFYGYASGGLELIGVIYDNSGSSSKPNYVMDYGSSVSWPTSADWISLPLGSTEFTAQSFWIGRMQSTGAATHYFYDSTSGTRVYSTNSGSYPTPPDPFGTASGLASRLLSVYCTYTASGGAAGGPVNEPITSGTLRLTSYAPVVSTTALESVNEPIPAGTLNLTGYAPATSIYGGHLFEPIPSGTLRLVGYVPETSIRRGFIPKPIPQSALVITSYAPETLVRGGKVSEPIPAATLRLSSYAPETSTSIANKSFAIPAATLTLTGYAPETRIPFINRAIPAATLRLVSYNPNFSIPHNVQMPIPAAALRLVSYAPEADIPSAIVKARVEGGLPRKIKPRRVIIDGDLHEVYSQEELDWIIKQYLDKWQSELWALESPKEKTQEAKKKIRVIKAKITKAINKLSDEAYDDEEELLLMLVA